MRPAPFAALAAMALALAVWWDAGTLLTQPARRAVAPPADLAVEPFHVASPAGALAAWALPADSARGVVVLMHGVRADRSSQAARMRLFRAAGYHTVAFDFQAHGESPGRRITFGAREQHDAVAAVQAARARFPGLPVAVVGQSMGGAAALLAGERLGADALVVEAVYATVERATANRLGMRLGRIGAAAAPLLTAQLPLRTGVAPASLRPAEAIARVLAPVLVAGGAKDRHAQPDETRALYAAAPPPKALWLVPGAAHVDLLAYDPAAYRSHVLPWLDRHLGG